jgi:hypothetical protein
VRRALPSGQPRRPGCRKFMAAQPVSLTTGPLLPLLQPRSPLANASRS